MASRPANLETISADERQMLTSLIQRLGRKGVLVGLYRGEAAWDVRPLVLERGSTFMLRSTSPSLAPELQQELQQIALLNYANTMQGASVVSSVDGRVWVQRPFTSKTLVDVIPEIQPGNYLKLFQPVFESLRALHGDGFAHGNVCPANLGFIRDQVFLLDAGFARAADLLLAPGAYRTFRDGSGEHLRQDLKELSTLLLLWGGASLPPEQRSILERMARPTPNAFPSWFEIQGVFLPGVGSGGGVIRAVSGESSLPRAGRLISPPGSGMPDPSSKSEARTSQPETRSLSAESLGATPLPSATTARVPTAFNWKLLMGVAAALVFLGAIWLWRSDASPGDPLLYHSLWSSDQPSLQREVGRAAVSGDRAAQLVIVKAIQGGAEHPQIRNKIILLGFDPRWEADLSDQDREALLSIALAPLLPVERKQLPTISRMHPAVTLALLADLAPSQTLPIIDEVEVRHLASLPDPLGLVFRGFELLAPRGSFALPQARALAHLAGGGISQGAVDLFFQWKKDAVPGGSADLPALITILPLVQERPPLGETVFATLAGRDPSPVSDRIRWFLTEDLAQWKNVPKSILLQLAAGFFPSATLTYEQYSDLLQFPHPDVRRSAAGLIGKQFSSQADKQTVEVVAQHIDRLSRLQVISLFTFLTLPPKQSEVLISRWFLESPDSALVVQIVRARRDLRDQDPLTFAAAQYLKSHEWSASVGELGELATHPEVLVRALVVARLNPDLPAERAILEGMVKRESNARIRSALEQRLSGEVEEEAPTAEDLVELE